MLIRFGVRALALALGCSVASMSAVASTTLPESVRALLQNNPQLAASEAALRGANEDVIQAEGAFLPQVDLVGRFGREKLGGSSLSSSSVLRRWHDGNSSLLTIQQLIFDGGTTSSSVNRLKAIQDGVSNEGRAMRLALARKVAELYFEILKQRRLLDLAKQNIDVLVDIRERVKLGVKGGAVSAGDLYHVSARLDAGLATQDVREMGLRAAEDSFFRFTGVKADDLQDERDPVGFVDGVLSDARRISTSSTQGIVPSVVYSHPAYLQAKSNVDAFDNAVKAVRGSYAPQISAELSHSGSHKIEGVLGTSESAALMLVGRWNLFKGGADQARERAVISRKESALQTVRDVEQALVEEFSLAQGDVTGARQRLALFASQVRSQEQVKTVYLKQFELGKRSVLNVLDAENEYFVAQSNFATTRYQMLQGAYRLSAVTGSILDRLDVKAASASAPQ